MSGKNSLSNKPTGSLNMRNVILWGSLGIMAMAIIFFSVMNTESSIDTDGDGVVDSIDLDDDNDGIPDSKECDGTESAPFAIINGSFELPVIPNKSYKIMSASSVQGWYTTAPDNKIEIWSTEFLGIDSYEGEQFAELNANQVGANYQVINTTPGDMLHWSFAHRGRGSSSVPDVMQIEIGPEGGAYNFSQQFSDDNRAWGFYSGTYTIPAGQTETRFSLNAISTASSSNSVGNFVDAFELYSTGNCLADFDRDGVYNSLDLDSDNDGISDIIEAGGTDSNGDGQVDYPIPGDPSSMLDADGDGLADAYDDEDSGSGAGEVTNGTPLPTPNTDGQAGPDYLDIDADDDGIVDNTEAQSTFGYVAPSDSDTDGDGLDDAYDPDCNPCGSVSGFAVVPVNTDGDAFPDYQDTDSDGDGIPDSTEGHDTNDDKTVNGADTPLAHTGLAGSGTDADEDGLMDGYDNDNTDPDPTNGGMSVASHPGVSGHSGERYWRRDASLPVEWLGFDVKLKGSFAELDWATSSELNSDYFEVQRSMNGKSFEGIGQVKAVGHSEEITTYQYTDPGVTSIPNDRVYYRLRQVDIDGAFSFSSMLELSLESVEGSSLSVYPNPANGPLTIQWNSTNSEQTGRCMLLNQNGQIVMETQINPGQTELNWNVDGLQSGFYIVQLIQGDKKETQKLMLK